MGGALSTVSAICGVGFFACVGLSWLATLVLLWAHVHYGVTARTRSDRRLHITGSLSDLLETSPDPALGATPHGAVTTTTR